MARGEAKRKMGDNGGSKADFDRALAIFKSRKTKVSNFDPARIEVEQARHQAEQREKERREKEDLPESEDEIMARFNQLLTIAPENPVKPEYEGKQRGHIQNRNVEIEPEPMFALSYYARDNKLNGNTYTTREINEVNELRLLPMTLAMVSGAQTLNENEINRHFASIEYYDGLLASSRPRAVDYFARGLDYLLVKNPDAAVLDADRALALSADFALAFFLRADAHYLKWQMAQSGAGKKDEDGDKQAQTMLHQRQNVELLREVLSDLDSLLAISPKNVYAIYNKGNVYYLMGDYTSAISCYTSAIGIKPDLGQAYYNRGLMYLRLGNKDRGIADLSKAGELGILPSYNVLKRMH